MRDNQIPRRPRRQQPLSGVRRNNAVARRLVRVPLQDVGVEIARAVVHGPCGRGLGREGAVGGAVLDARGGAEDLVLRAHLLEVALEALVLGARVVLRLFEGREAVFEVFDVALLAFAECALTVGVSTGMTTSGATGMLPSASIWCLNRVAHSRATRRGSRTRRIDSRCAILGLPPRLSGCHILIIRVRRPAPRWWLGREALLLQPVPLGVHIGPPGNQAIERELFHGVRAPVWDRLACLVRWRRGPGEAGLVEVRLEAVVEGLVLLIARELIVDFL